MHHNVQDLMPGGSYGLKLSERILSWYGTPEETEQAMDKAHQRMHPDGEDEIKTLFKVCNRLFQKENSSHPSSSGKWVNVDTLPVNPGIMCD